MPKLKCPNCGAEIEYTSVEEAPFRPFCSKKCKLIDLGKWLNGEYRVSEELPESDWSDSVPPE
jgi:endogenous inhibitor of DNA gyrase (YacG/DUF329 family)